MPIEFACGCGKKLRAAAEHAGKRAKCGGCGEAVTIPGVKRGAAAPKPAAAAPLPANVSAPKKAPTATAQLAPFSNLADLLASELPPPGSPTPLPSARPSGPSSTYGNAIGGRSTAAGRAIAPQSRPKPRRRGPSPFAQFFINRLNSRKMWCGLAMMVGAAIWFFGALIYFHWIYFYPPILFVLGLISFFSGLIDGDAA